MRTNNNNSLRNISETEGTGFSFSESEGTGLSFSESEGTGIANHASMVSKISKFTLLFCLFVCNLSSANSLHLFSETNDFKVVNAVFHDKKNNQIHRITGYFEKNQFVGLISLPKSADDGSGDMSADDGSGDMSADDGSGDKSADDGSGDKSADDGSGNKSADDGSGDKSADDGSGNKIESIFTYELACSSPGNQFANIKSSTKSINLELSQIYLNGSATNCETIFSKVNNKLTD